MGDGHGTSGQPALSKNDPGEVTQPLPKWVKPQPARLADEAPNGKDWLHEVKYDRYRIYTRMGSSRIKR
jgi:bifunctional non-homologous end joining protein LigD